MILYLIEVRRREQVPLAVSGPAGPRDEPLHLVADALVALVICPVTVIRSPECMRDPCIIREGEAVRIMELLRHGVEPVRDRGQAGSRKVRPVAPLPVRVILK